MLEFTFGQVEATLAAINDIAEHKRVAFAGRLKFLQRNGIPARNSTGRGKVGAFSLDHLLQMAVSVELLQAGLPPQRAAALTLRAWWLRLDEIYSVARQWRTKTERKMPDVVQHMRRRPADWMWLVLYNGLEEMMDTGELIQHPASGAITALATKELGNIQYLSRGVVINPSHLFVRLFDKICALKFASMGEILSDMEAMEENLANAADLFERTVATGKMFTGGPWSNGNTLFSISEKQSLRDRIESLPENISLQEEHSIQRLLLYALSYSSKMLLVHALRGVSSSSEAEFPDATKLLGPGADACLTELAELGIIYPHVEGSVPVLLTKFGRRFLGAAFGLNEMGMPDVDPQA